jgi:predicted dienelactone hydrolase
MKVRLIVTGAVALVLALAPATMEGQRDRRDDDAPRYSGREVGPAPVGSIPDVRLRDNERGKDIELTIDYPMAGRAHPLIVLSPGFGGSHRGYVGLSAYWAGNNYVVIRLNHADKTAEVKSAEDLWANATPADWKNRVRDVTFVLDSLPALAKEFPELEGKIDAAKIAVAGHSYGAHTAMLAGGARTFPGGVSYADPRVKAVLVMSPQGPSEQRGLTNESWAELRVPAMFMTGSEDRGTTEAETPEWRAEGYRLAPAGDKWLVQFEGAGHLTFAGGAPGTAEVYAGGVSIPVAPDPSEPDRIPGTTRGAPTMREVMARGPNQPRGARVDRHKAIFANVRGVALAFFDTYLRADTEGRAALEKTGERADVTVEKK